MRSSTQCAMITLVATLVAIGMVSQVAAEAPLSFMFAPDGSYAPFESKPAKDLMTAAEYDAYQKHLQQQECDAAELILNGAFVRTYPQFSKARKKDTKRYDQDYKAWNMYARSRFNGYGFCNLITDLAEVGKKLSVFTIRSQRYEYHTTDWKTRSKNPPYHKLLFNRHIITIRLFLDLAHDGYTPALMFVADLVKRGDVFHDDIGADIEFYLLTRACHLSHDCESIKQRITDLGQSLSSEQRDGIRREARAKTSVVLALFHGGFAFLGNALGRIR